MSGSSERMWGHYDFVGHGHDMAMEAPAGPILAKGEYEQVEIPRGALRPAYQSARMAAPVMPAIAVSGDAVEPRQKRPYVIPMPLIWAAGSFALGLVGYVVVSSKRR